MADEHYDAIVIGTSQGGRFLPIELASRPLPFWHAQTRAGIVPKSGGSNKPG